MLSCNEIIEKNKLSRDISKSCKLNCFSKGEANETYNIYIFTMQVSTQKELEDNWEMFVNNISISFQANLELDIEKWNIYNIFLVKEKVSDVIKYRIEQDKFATRKIVLDSKRQYGGIFDESENETNCLEQIVNKKLFTIKIERKNLQKESDFRQYIEGESQLYNSVLDTDKRVDRLIEICQKFKGSKGNA